jgi:SAM-dependent methyltransferase
MTPAAWVCTHAALLPDSGRALDVACGRGRHAIWLAARGLHVTAVDRDEQAIDALRRGASDRALPVSTVVADLETGNYSPGLNAFDVIIAVHYLHRPLFPALIAALRPDGVLIYETFTRDQARRGKPTNPDFLLERGELRRLIEPLDVLDYREGVFEEKDLASVVARKRLVVGG